MHADILDSHVPVLPKPGQGEPCGFIEQGSQVALGKTHKLDSGTFTFVRTATGMKGYIPGATRIQQVKPARLLKDTPRCGYPNAPEATLFKKGEFVTLMTGSTRDGWVQVRSKTGEYYFIPASTRISILPDNLRAAGAKQIAIGLALAAAAIGGTMLSQSAANSGGTYIVFTGPFIYGVFLVFRGSIHLIFNR